MPAPINWVMNSDKLKWPFECNKTLSTRRRSVFPPLSVPFLFWLVNWEIKRRRARCIWQSRPAVCCLMTQSEGQRRAPKARVAALNINKFDSWAVRGKWKFSSVVILQGNTLPQGLQFRQFIKKKAQQVKMKCHCFQQAPLYNIHIISPFL